MAHFRLLSLIHLCLWCIHFSNIYIVCVCCCGCWCFSLLFCLVFIFHYVLCVCVFFALLFLSLYVIAHWPQLPQLRTDFLRVWYALVFFAAYFFSPIVLCPLCCCCWCCFVFCSSLAVECVFISCMPPALHLNFNAFFGILQLLMGSCYMRCVLAHSMCKNSAYNIYIYIG